MKVKTGASRMNGQQVLGFSANVVASSAGKTELDDITPSKTELGTATTAYNTALIQEGLARDIYYAKAADSQANEIVLRKTLGEFAIAADALYGGDASSLQAIGLDVRGFPQPVGLLPAPANVRAFAGPMDESIHVRWNALAGRTQYELECASGASGPFNRVYNGGEPSFICSGLTPGAEYWFRVRAYSAAGPSPWSNVVRRRVA
jgi:hypothetical protein